MNMRKNSFRIALLAAGLSTVSAGAFAQLGSIPAAVTDSFNVRFPGATNVNWKNKITVFQADFVFKNTTEQARFNKKGEWQMTEKVIPKESLPAEVRDGLDKSKYATDWKVNTIFQRDRPGQVVEYRIEVYKSDIQKKSLLFSSAGRLLKDSNTL
ncbi:MAG: PepSY-like domain-containing protein [Bacteroidota bacterium]|nr:PepSY-like domain-containing protein [Bacteroidota bacterium]MDP4215347.1 PepSY-like domain-containing protein [Bacteroidota bacterium]MDP4255322.1 PepSY-like domain-containing protein [Bacteroidota bacterium]MDP4258776.1 PepSY-like domain-containing protein [Bacteroidota bacterium]